MATFRKTREGAWAVFGPANEVTPGSCSVNRADGSVRTVTVTSTSRPFDVNGVPHVYGYIEDKAHDSSPRASSRSGGESCAECGRAGATIECADSSGIRGLCCPRCARLSRYERSFA